MKEIFQKFFKNKLNVVLLIIQVVALVFFACSSDSRVSLILFFVLESIFFIIWGIKIIIDTKLILKEQELIMALPYTQEQLDVIRKQNAIKIKNEKFRGISLIIIGSVLIVVFITSFIH